MLALPKSPISLWILGISLSSTSGARALDYLGLISQIDPNGVAAGELIGAMLLPLYLVPFVVLLSLAALTRYPIGPMKITHWKPAASLRYYLWNAIYLLLAAASLVSAFEQLRLAAQLPAKLPEHDLTVGVVDTLFNAVSWLGAVLFWLSLRAVKSYKLTSDITKWDPPIHGG